MSSRSSTPLGNHRLTLENTPVSENSRATWGDLVAEWERYLRDKESENLVFLGDGRENDGEIKVAPYSHRFKDEYTEMQYAKIQDFVRGSLSEYDNPYLVFLTFSSSTTKPNGEPRPPIPHMNEVTESWNEGVYYELNRVMEGDRKRDPWEPRPHWEYLYILEPTTNEGRVPGGYTHAHAAIVVDGKVESSRFESVIRRHLTECPGAKGEAHEFDDAIEVKSAEELGNPGAYLFKYLGKSWKSAELEDYERRFAALLFDQERQRFRASNGAQRWLQRDENESEAGDWIFAGVANDEQAEALRWEFEDYEDFLMSTGEDVTGLRSWLSKDHAVRRAERKREESASPVKISREEYWARESVGIPMPGEGGNEPIGDRPPPA